MLRYYKLFWLLLFVALTSCGPAKTPKSFTITVEPVEVRGQTYVTECIITLRWQVPTQNEDSSLIEPGELAELQLYGDGVSWDEIPVRYETLWITDPYVLMYQDRIFRGSWAFVATVTNQQQEKSKPSGTAFIDCPKQVELR